MRKGKFDLALAFYPIAALICVIIKQPVLCALVTGLAIFVEKDEWAGRQSLQALFLGIFLWIFSDFLPWAASLCPIPLIKQVVQTGATVLHVLVYLAAILLSIFGILRLMKEQEADFPLLSDLAYRAYGKAKPKALPTIPGTNDQQPKDPPELL